MPAMEMAGSRRKRKVRAFYGRCLVALVARSWLVARGGCESQSLCQSIAPFVAPFVASLPTPRLAAGCSDSIGQLSVRRPTLSQRGSEAVLTAVVVATATDSQSTPSCAAQRVLPTQGTHIIKNCYTNQRTSHNHHGC